MLRKDDEAFELAKGCADHAECGKKRACYDLYRNGFPNGRHLGEVERAIAADPCPNAASLPEGIYNGRASRESSLRSGSGVGASDDQGWEDLLGAQDRLRKQVGKASVGPDGVVEAKTRGRNGTAAGRVVNGGSMNIEMNYPECNNRIRIQIGGMISSTPAPCR